MLQKFKFFTVFSPSLILVGEGFCFVRKPVWMGGKSVSEKKRERAVTGLTTRLCGCTAVITGHFLLTIKR
jgi:hypothetical protein